MVIMDRDKDGMPVRIYLDTGAKKRRSDPEELFAFQIASVKLQQPVREHRFDVGGRKWRFDFAWPDRLVAAEVEGGIFVGGRHTRGSGFEKDSEKYNTAAAQGWLVLRFTPRQVKSGEALRWLEKAFELRPRQSEAVREQR